MAQALVRAVIPKLSPALLLSAGLNLISVVQPSDPSEDGKRRAEEDVGSVVSRGAQLAE